MCRIVALASMETKNWENANPATEPVRCAPAWATTSAAAVKKGWSCGMGRVSGPRGPRWKVRSGMVRTCQREAQHPLCLPPSLALFLRNVLRENYICPKTPKSQGAYETPR